MGNGEVTIEMSPQPSTTACFAAARQMVLHDPRQFGAIAIGAGCVVHPDGRSSER